MLRPRPGLDRAADLDRAATQGVDVLVVGAGATGAGIALDASTRGLSVLLVDRGDVAQGTSSKSSKLVHGGLRYLANGDVPMVAEGVRERDRLRRMAPHLVRPLGFVVPTDTVADAALLAAGMLAYDSLAAGRGVAGSARLSPADVLRQAPVLARGFDRGGAAYYDAQTDDARLVLACAMAARRHGAGVATHTAVDAITTGVFGHAVSLTTADDQELQVQARHVVLAAGVWGDHTGLVDDVGFATTPAKGVHLTFSRHEVPVDRATVIPSAAADGRRLFLVPWGAQVYVGTSDVPDPDGRAGPSVTQADADYLLDAVNLACGTTLSVTDAVGAWAGLRPLVATGPDADTADLSRQHTVTAPVPGLWAVTGGKLTTFRQMAEDVVDRILDADHDSRPCVTAATALGASGTVAAGRARAHAAADRVGLCHGAADTLWHRHGDRVPEVIRWCHERDALDVAIPELPYLVGELSWAVEVEGARTVNDVLARRLRATDRDAAAGGAVADRVADLVAAHLGWDESKRTASLEAHTTAVRHERGVIPLP